jgi:hypothetical protein
MKPLLLALLMSLASRAEETQLFYAPTPAALTGVLARETGETAAAKDTWTLLLPRQVTVNPGPGGEGGVLETDVKEVRLSGDDGLIRKAAESKSSVTFYGKLSRAADPKDPRHIVMEVSAWQVATPPTREIRRSPDGKVFVAWVDQDLGPPLGTIRSIFLRYAIDQDTLFSVVSSPRDTKAAWNPSSSRCIIADAPDNGGPRTWLVVRKSPDAWEWKSRVIEPFQELYKEFRKTDPEVHRLFRPSLLKIEWISETKVRFRAYCNTGTWLLTMDMDRPDEAPVSEKLSDRFLEE